MLAANRAPDEWIGVSNDCQRAGIAKSNLPTEHWLTSPSLKDKTRSRNIEQWKVRTATPAEKDVDIDKQALAGVTAGPTRLKLNTFPEPLLGIGKNQPICDDFVEGSLLKENEDASLRLADLCQSLEAISTRTPQDWQTFARAISTRTPQDWQTSSCQSDLNTDIRAAATQPPSPAPWVASFEKDGACLVDLGRRGFELDRARENEMRKRVCKARALWRG